MYEFKLRFSAMGARNEIQLFARSMEEAEELAAPLADEVLRIESKYSRYRDDSVLSRINAAAGGSEPVEVDEETAGLIEYAAACYRESEGLFDVTSGVLRKGWNFSSPVLPDPVVLAELLSLVGWSRVVWDPPRIRLPDAGMELDFGGLGKEYAADSAAVVANRLGIGSGLINLGGDIRIIGARPDGRPWELGITDPRDPKKVIGSVALDSGALATSGDYERYFELHGRRYSHLLDPRTGMPIDGFRSVTVAASTCLVAGSLSTVAMLAGERDGTQILESSGAFSVSVGRDGEIMAHGSTRRLQLPKGSLKQSSRSDGLENGALTGVAEESVHRDG